MCKEIRDKFVELYSKDVNKYVEKKEGLSYLSWAYAWAEFKKVYPDATYEVKKDAEGRCYFGNPFALRPLRLGNNREDCRRAVCYPLR